MASHFITSSADAGDAGVGLVVHEQILAVILAVGERHVDVVKIAVVVDLLAVGRKVLLRLVGHRALVDVRDSLVSPQPVAEQRLKTGTRINSRIEGMPRMRISPDWPEDQKP